MLGARWSPDKALAAAVVAAMAVVRIKGVALLTSFRRGYLCLAPKVISYIISLIPCPASLLAGLLVEMHPAHCRTTEQRAFHANHKGTFIINFLHYLFAHDNVGPIGVTGLPLASI